MAIIEKSNTADGGADDRHHRTDRSGGASTTLPTDEDRDEFDDPDFVQRYFEAIEQSEATQREEVATREAQREAIDSADNSDIEYMDPPTSL